MTTRTDASPRLGGGVALVVGSCFSLQFGAAIATHLFPLLGAWGVTSLRMLMGAAILLIAVRPRMLGWSWPQWRAVILFGAALAGMNGFFYASIDRIPLGAAVAVEFLGPLVLAAVLSRRAVDYAMVGVALAGMCILGLESFLTADSLDPLGVLFALIAGAFWAGYVLSSAHVGQAVPGTGGLAAAMGVATVMVLPIGASSAVQAFADWRILLLAAATGLLASVIPYTLELAALRKLPRNVFSILLSLEPAIAAVAGWLLLSQTTGLLRWVAIALVIVASVGITASSSRPRKLRDTGAEGQEQPVVELGTGVLPVIEPDGGDESVLGIRTDALPVVRAEEDDAGDAGTPRR